MLNINNLSQNVQDFINGVSHPEWTVYPDDVQKFIKKSTNVGQKIESVKNLPIDEQKKEMILWQLKTMDEDVKKYLESKDGISKFDTAWRNPYLREKMLLCTKDADGWNVLLSSIKTATQPKTRQEI